VVLIELVGLFAVLLGYAVTFWPANLWAMIKDWGDVKWLVLNTTCHSGLQYRITLDEILDPFVEDLH
jgi:hypothetical protein